MMPEFLVEISLDFAVWDAIHGRGEWERVENGLWCLAEGKLK